MNPCPSCHIQKYLQTLLCKPWPWFHLFIYFCYFWCFDSEAFPTLEGPASPRISQLLETVSNSSTERSSITNQPNQSTHSNHLPHRVLTLQAPPTCSSHSRARLWVPGTAPPPLAQSLLKWFKVASPRPVYHASLFLPRKPQWRLMPVVPLPAPDRPWCFMWHGPSS